MRREWGRGIGGVIATEEQEDLSDRGAMCAERLGWPNAQPRKQGDAFRHRYVGVQPLFPFA